MTEGTMKLWECDCGATYWVAAPNLRSAVDAMFQCWEAEGSLEDMEDSGFSIESVPESRGVRLQLRNEDGSAMTMWDAMKQAKQAEVLGCTEWP